MTQNIRKYNQEVKIEAVELEMRPKRVRIILTTDIGEITHKLKHIVEEISFSNALNMDIKETKEIPVTKENLNNVMPNIIREMANTLKKTKKPLNCHLTYSIFVSDSNEEAETEPKEYKFMYLGDVNNIYCKEIDGDDISKIEEQMKREEENKHRIKMD